MFRALNLRKSPSTVYLSTSSRRVVSSSSLSSLVLLFSTPYSSHCECDSCAIRRRHHRLQYTRHGFAASMGRRQNSGQAMNCQPWMMHAELYRLNKDGLCCCVSHAIDVLQRELDTLLVGDFHATHTCTLDAQRHLPSDGLHTCTMYE